MSNQGSITRVPLGLIVEGDGEYHSYPYLVRKITSSSITPPIVNAHGSTQITHHLEEKLDRIVQLHHPHHIIITLDLVDIIRSNLYIDCADAKSDLVRKISNWLSSSSSNSVLLPLPASIEVVLQIQMLESWLISDLANLITSSELSQLGGQPSNIDNSILDPIAWIKDNYPYPINTKSPSRVRTIIQSLDPSSMRQNSPSFDKFYREVSSLHLHSIPSIQVCSTSA